MRGVYIAKNGFLAVFPLFGKTQKRPFLRNSDPDRPHIHNWSFFLVIRTIRPSFVQFGPKLRVLPYTGRNGQKWPFFGPRGQEKGHNSETKSRKIVRRYQNDRNGKGYKRFIDENRGPISKNGFSDQNTAFLAQKICFFLCYAHITHFFGL